MRTISVSASILHGEVFGLVAAVLSLRSSPIAHSSSQPPVITDHLNSARLISDSFVHTLLPHTWATLPARSLYRWLHNLLSHFPTRPVVTYTAAHTSSTTLPSIINAHADHYASSSQYRPLPVPTLPVPSFFMDRFTPFTEQDGFIEYNIASFVHHFSSIAVASDPSFRPNKTHIQALYDGHTLPEYPYTRASSAYSAVVQLYSRSSQLPSGSLLSTRFGDGAENCRRSEACSHNRSWVLDDQHHIFVTCPAFQHLRDQYTQRAFNETTKLLEDTHLSPTTSTAVFRVAAALFRDDAQVWPEYRSRYYLGAIPSVDPLFTSGVGCMSTEFKRLTHRLAHLWHTIAIQLAGRIWGECLKLNRFALPPNLPSTTVTHIDPILLPSHFPRILFKSLSS